ncbi:hypothetical protein ABIC60_003575 [Phyllobacterium ifriqiyense]
MASFSNDAPITPLRQRMQKDMVMRFGILYATGLHRVSILN